MFLNVRGFQLVTSCLSTRALVQGTVPFIAVASAGVANMLLMRRKEAFDGVKVYTKDGNALRSLCCFCFVWSFADSLLQSLAIVAGFVDITATTTTTTTSSIHCSTSSGAEVGTSAAAGRQALTLTAITRVLVPVPALLLPSLIMLRLSRLPVFQSNRVLKTTAEIGY
jgi:hypothetical protein